MSVAARSRPLPRSTPAPVPGPRPARHPGWFPLRLSLGDVVLEPLAAGHAAAIEAAAAGADDDPVRPPLPAPGEGGAWVAGALAEQDAGHRLAFAVVRGGQVVGSTSLYDFVPDLPRVELGRTWYAPQARRTHVNATAKLLLLEHAFGALGCAAVGWRTDGANHASRRALASLGARCDGVLRRHELRRDGTLRDTACFSLLAEEWPQARTRLYARLARHAG